MRSSTVIGISPSFTSLSSNNLADVAARVVQEFRYENGHDYDDIFNYNDYDYDTSEFPVCADDKADTITPPDKLKHDKDCDPDDDDEFEFAVTCNDVNSSSVSQLSTRYPLFDRSLLLEEEEEEVKDCKPSLVVRIPLRKLFSEERDFASCTSSEADDLDGVAPGTYCVWKPKAETPGRCKKSNSTGNSNSSRRWSFRNILYRSNSEGNHMPFLLFKPLTATNKKINDEKVKKVEKSAKVAATVGDGTSTVATEEAENGGSRRRSYLPSAFTNVSRSNRNLRPL